LTGKAANCRDSIDEVPKKIAWTHAFSLTMITPLLVHLFAAPPEVFVLSKQIKVVVTGWVAVLSFFLVSPNASLFAQTLTVLHTFDSSHGQYPNAPLIRDSAGNLYGTTTYGSAGYGTIFKLDRAGKYTVLYSFGGSPGDGSYPAGGLLRDKNGDFYGTTSQGGTTNGGTIFKLDSGGDESVLYNFVSI
jgi:uncharacterized repeat protein (TIGR03803 family)